MIYSLLGDSELLKELFVKSKANNPTIIFPDDDEKFAKLERAVTTSLMFAKNNGIWLKKFKNWNKQERATATSLIEKMGDGLLLFVEDKPMENSKIINFELPKPWDKKGWERFINDLASKLEIEVEKKAVERLFELFGGKEWILFSELKKLKALNKKISLEDIEFYCYAMSTTTSEEISMNILKGIAASAVTREIEESNIVFPQLLSSLSKLLFDLGLIKEAYQSNSDLAGDWKSLLKLEKITGIKAGRVAKITGFAFSGTTGGPNLVTLYSLKKIKTSLVELQKLDESYKNGELNDKSGFLQLLSLFVK
ncbi:hypothetical protein AT15_09310 [Kosmotoga arenicorallina S304]|uniref:DNA polymerase III delta N-terminal domain-containing protein n=1 Tax=Kosmotoga arenicorallina S304 TaxID=1453497 RepID=A0A176K186_9BACT|nr:hypothetical protein [Kosmotoga arenicorallina]OAA30872.1 hypothetical protein AT15_09310 [Kosmotoga arenicorallina S304]